MNKLLEDLMDDVSKTNITIPIKSIPDLKDINLGELRIEYISKVLEKALPSLSKVNWTNIKESDPEYSDFTTARLTGNSAVDVGNMLLDGAKDGSLRMTKERLSELSDENEVVLRFEIPGVNDCQLFYFDANGSQDDELVIAVRPVTISKRVNIEL